MHDGAIAAVGTDHQLYTRATLTSNWVNVPNSGTVNRISVPTNESDNSLYGISLDQKVFRRPQLGGVNWGNPLQVGGGITSVAELPSGRVIATGSDGQLYTVPTLNPNWSLVPKSWSVLSVTTLPDGRLLATGTNNWLYVTTLPANWAAVTQNGFKLPKETIWSLVPNSGSVKCATVLPGGIIAGVGMDQQIYTRATLSSNWVLTPNAWGITSLAVFPNGRFIATGTDNQLWTRDTLTSNGVQVPNSGSVTCVVVMPDGTIAGIGIDKQVYTRATLTSNWVLVPNSGSVISLSVLPDGRLMGVGTDFQVYTRAALTNNWAVVPNS
ncbi:MAG: WD40 repeat domain-containing protein [Cytophagaceae bacterium]|nr:MAG: WD40 repeat domain-containing protein [Cytophagaceae bacterium]